MKHIGIVGVTAEGASLCYRTICEEASELLGPHIHPEISLHNHSFSRIFEVIGCHKNSLNKIKFLKEFWAY